MFHKLKIITSLSQVSIRLCKGTIYYKFNSNDHNDDENDGDDDGDDDYDGDGGGDDDNDDDDDDGDEDDDDYDDDAISKYSANSNQHYEL